MGVSSIVSVETPRPADGHRQDRQTHATARLETARAEQHTTNTSNKHRIKAGLPGSQGGGLTRLTSNGPAVQRPDTYATSVGNPYQHKRLEVALTGARSGSCAASAAECSTCCCGLELELGRHRMR